MVNRMGNGVRSGLHVQTSGTAKWMGILLAAVFALPGVARADQPASAPASAPQSRLAGVLDQVQGLMAAEGIDGWLLYDAGGTDPIALDLVQPANFVSRPWFYLVPQTGAPVALVPEIEADSFAGVPGQQRLYGSWRDLQTKLQSLLGGAHRLAMDYSPMGAIPELSRVDAGTVELVKSLGVQVVSSGDLVAIAESRWTDSQRISHYVAAHHLEALKDEALAFIAQHLQAGEVVTEHDVQAFLSHGYTVRGIESDFPPIVATGVHTADPSYMPEEAGSAEIHPGDLVLIELWGRVQPGSPGAGDEPNTVYADVTWMAYAGATVPAEDAKLFGIVAQARDAALALVKQRFASATALHGFEVDDAARAVVTEAGFGDDFIHRTGHSIDVHVNGAGPNLDDYETKDTRLLQRGMGFSIEPGIYLAGQIGVRSEIDVFLGAQGPEVSTAVQTAITPLLAPASTPTPTHP
jgi:Xaa-Pro aminopeptidase